MIDLGKKDIMDTAVPSRSKNRVYYPSLHIDKKTDYIAKKDVGKTVMATVKLKVKSHEERVDESGKEAYSCSFDVMGIDFGKKKVNIAGMSKEDLDDAEHKEYSMQTGLEN